MSWLVTNKLAMNSAAAKQSRRDCLTVAELKSWVGSSGSDTEGESAQTIQQHLNRCENCLERAIALGELSEDEPSDPIVQALSVGPGSRDDELELQQLQQRLIDSQPNIDLKLLSAQLHQEAKPVSNPFAGRLPFELGSYLLLDCIGRGASGAVYRARHKNLERDVAVKVLSSSSTIGPHVDSFIDEMKHAGRLTHPNIIRATDAGESHGFHYLVMEYVEGVDVSRLLKTHGPLTVADACEVVRQAALGLHFAHKNGLVHRDVKPANILLTRCGEVKLLDLGIATKTGDSLSETGRSLESPVATEPQNARGRPVGTASYMAPEQWDLAATIDPRTDIYGLGCSLLKLIVGKLPAASANEPGSRADEVQQLIATCCSSSPRGLTRLIQGMMAEDPADRPATAAEAAESLSSLSRNAKLTNLVAEVCGTADQNELFDTPVSRQTTRRLWIRNTAIGAAALAGVAGAGWSIGSLRRRPRLARSRWRDLAPSEPRIMLSQDNAKQIDCHAVVGGVTIASTQFALVSLGRPVVGEFKFRADFKQTEWSGDVGLFFNARQTETHASDKQDAESWVFQSIDLRPPSEDPEHGSHRLLWSEWTATGEQDEQGGWCWAVNRDPWAETRVAVAKTNSQRLVIQLGRSGMPEVEWNGRQLHANSWKLSTTGRRRISWSANRLPSTFLGQLGLLNLSGANVFLQPQLAYL